MTEPMTGDWVRHADVPNHWIQIKAVRRWPFPHAELASAAGPRFSAPLSSLFVPESEEN